MWDYPALRLQSVIRQAGPRNATTFVARGQGFEAGAQIMMVREHGSLLDPADVIGGNDIRIASQNQLSFVANLEAKAVGSYDALLVLPSKPSSMFAERSAVLGGAYEVQSVDDEGKTWPHDVLGALRPEFPEALVPAEAWARITRAAALGPVLQHGDISFECHLRSETPRVDLILRMLPADRDAHLARAGDDPRLSQTNAFLRRWADAGGGFAHIPWVDLESDLHSEKVHEPYLVPGIEAYYDYPAETLEARKTSGDAALPIANLSVVQSILQALHGPDVCSELVAGAELVLGALPRGGFMMGLGLLQCRWASPSDALRVVVSLPSDEVSAFFDRVGWPISPDTCRELLTHAESRVSLDLDLHQGTLGPRVARYFTFASPHPRCRRLEAAIDQIRQRNLAHPDRLEALYSWVRASRSADERTRRVLTIKLIGGPGGVAEAKAYFTFGMPPARDLRIPGLA